jgi:hypothetical protein
MGKVIIANKEINKCIEVLYEQMKGFDYGISLNWQELEDICKPFKKDIKRQELYYILEKVNELMQIHERKYLQTIYGFGKRIILPSEHTEESRKNTKRAAKIYKKSGIILASVNQDKLTPEELKEVETEARKWRTLELLSSELTRKKKLKLSTENNDSNLLSNVIELFSKK